ncbi:MAG TPA: extracellular solute-binding protein, partial [Tepidisphaeraceae bacterium]|nr:extracellular solute-binding protein [Tepidisphaeraceae bacterium]
MTIPRAFRLLLSLAAILIVVWAFFDVIHRGIQRNSAQHDRPITLTVLHWGDQAEDQIMEALDREFEDQHQNIRIVRINPGAGDYESKLKTMLAAGTPPDVFYLRPEMLRDFASMKLIAPLDQQFAAEPKEWKDDFIPIMLNAWRYNAATDKIGDHTATLYGLPKDFTTAVMYVNLDLFQKAGIPVPYKGWTWDEYEADIKKITDLSGTPAVEGRAIYGGSIEIWHDTVRNIIWTYGGDFFGPGGFRDVTLDAPPAQEALQMLARTRQVAHTVYNPTVVGQEGGEEFLRGGIGVLGPLGRWKVPRMKEVTAFKWDCVPLPHKTQEASMVWYTAWSMSSASPHPKECYELIKYLTGAKGQILAAHLGLAVPSLKSVAYSDDFLNPPGMPKHNSQAFLDAVKVARIQQVPREPEWARICGEELQKALLLGTEKPAQMAQVVKQRWLSELDSPLRQQQWQPMRWNIVLSITIGLLVTLFAALWWRARGERLGALDRAQERAGWSFIAPWVIGFLALTLGPMIASLLLSFTHWSAMSPISEADSVGAANYKQLFTHDQTFLHSLNVTVYYVLLAVPIGQAAALAVAMLMNLRLRSITAFRTIYFVPSVVGGAALAVLWLQLLDDQYGLVNHIMRPILGLVHLRPPNWFGADYATSPPTDDAARWAIPALVIMGLWGVGSGMIIYLAGLKGIPASLYEAATIDGAGPTGKFFNVTLPMLSPLIFYNLVMGIIGSFQIFTQAKIMTNG